jgi:hypothetical protein
VAGAPSVKWAPELLLGHERTRVAAVRLLGFIRQRAQNKYLVALRAALALAHLGTARSAAVNPHSTAARCRA